MQYHIGATSRSYCPSVWMIALLLHVITIIRTASKWCCPDVQDGCNSSPRIALSRIASERCFPVIWMDVAIFPYLCLWRKFDFLSNSDEHLDGCNLDLFESSRHWWASGQYCQVVRTDVADWWASGRFTGLLRTEAWDPTSLSWNLHKIFFEHFETLFWNEYSGKYGILGKTTTLHDSDFVNRMQPIKN
jgi:hypothetical protein